MAKNFEDLKGEKNAPLGTLLWDKEDPENFKKEINT